MIDYVLTGIYCVAMTACVGVIVGCVVAYVVILVDEWCKPY